MFKTLKLRHYLRKLNEKPWYIKLAVIILTAVLLILPDPLFAVDEIILVVASSSIIRDWLGG